VRRSSILAAVSAVFPALVACGGGAAMAPASTTGASPTSSTGATSSTPDAASELASSSITPSTSTATAPSSSASPTPVAVTPLEAHATFGPFKNPALACKALAAATKAKAVDCLPGGNVAAPPAKSAIDRLLLLVVRDKATPDASVTHLAMHTSGGWYVDPDGPESFVDAAMMKRFKTDVLPGGNSVIADGAITGVTFGVRQDFTEMTIVVATDPTTGKKSLPRFHSVRSTTVVCAVGPSGAPSCLDPIRTDLDFGKDGAPPASPSAVPFAPKNGVWSVDANAKLSVLRAAGNFQTHEDVALSGSYSPSFK
jgi:hypothetical protein